MSDKAYTNGEYIFREGESAAYAYVIKSGIVEIVKNSASGVQVLAELTPPTIFGEMALIDGNPRSAGARAKESSIVTESGIGIRRTFRSDLSSFAEFVTNSNSLL